MRAWPVRDIPARSLTATMAERAGSHDGALAKLMLTILSSAGGTAPPWLNKEIKRRTDIVGVFPHPDALLRLAGAVLVEAHGEWQAGERRYLAEGSMALLATPPATPEELATPALLTA